MASESKANLDTRGVSLWLIVLGLSPAVWLMVCGYFIGPINVHPESLDFPRWKMDLLLGGMVIISFVWAFFALRKESIHWLLRVPAIILVGFIAHFVNFVVGMAGCGVIAGLGGLVQ